MKRTKEIHTNIEEERERERQREREREGEGEGEGEEEGEGEGRKCAILLFLLFFIFFSFLLFLCLSFQFFWLHRLSPNSCMKKLLGSLSCRCRSDNSYSIKLGILDADGVAIAQFEDTLEQTGALASVPLMFDLC